ncbi:MAG: Spy/CpxP family protein refolding chaperone [bacterium]
MKNLGIVVGCVVGMTMIATANEPVGQGARPTPPMRQARGEMRDGGDMLMWMRPVVMKQLELTSEQQSQIAAVVNAATNEISSLRTKMQALAKKQAELMGAEPIDENAVLQLADEIGKVRSDMAKVQIKQMLVARKILTAEQRLKMREMMKNYMDKSEGRRPGGKMLKGENKPGEGSAPAKAE